MVTENHWRAPRIHVELLRLGFSVSERTVSRYLRGLPSRPESRQNWRIFMKNHREVIAAMDFFTVPTASFRLLYVLFVIRIKPNHEVEQHHVDVARVLQRGKALAPARGGPDVVSRRREVLAKRGTRNRVVLDDEDGGLAIHDEASRESLSRG
jgi:hypothetical protein